jgi:hypothetical protein
MEAHTCTPSYSGSRDQDLGSKAAQANSSEDPISKIPSTCIHRNVTSKPTYSYLKPKKCHFFFIKTENRSVEQVLSGGLVPVGERRMWGEG